MTEEKTQAVVAEVAQERWRQQAELGYTEAHDDEAGAAHLAQEAYYRLGHMGEVSSPEAARAELVKVAALAVAGIEVIDRSTQEPKQ